MSDTDLDIATLPGSKRVTQVKADGFVFDVYILPGESEPDAWYRAREALVALLNALRQPPPDA